MAYNYVQGTGIIVADTTDTLSAIQTQYQTNFGSDIDLTPSTPQGLMISAETLSQQGVAQQAAMIANQINPNIAGGIFLDAIMALMGIERTPATYSTVTVSLTGTPGTILNAGMRVQSTNLDIFVLTTSTTIPTSGTIDAIFQAQQSGAIPCLSGTINKIIDTTLGLTSVLNANNGVIGLTTQSDLGARALRRNTLANIGSSTLDSIAANIALVNGVTSMQYLENNLNTTQTISGITLVANSIWFCVNGGLSTDIATAIFKRRSAGLNTNGAVSTPFTTTSGQVLNMNFDRPIAVPILIRVTVRLTNSDSSTVNSIINNILNYANGLMDGEVGFAVGQNVSPFDISGASSSIAGVYIKLVEIALASDGIYQTTEIAMNINQIATTTSPSIQVVLV